MIIKSILDTDLYKFSTSYAYFKLYPNAMGTFHFNDRNKENWSEEEQKLFSKLFNEELNQVEKLYLNSFEENWCIANIPYIPRTYWEWLLTFRFKKSNIVYFFDSFGIFHCSASDYLYKITFYEILILSLYSEIRNKIKEKKYNIKPNMDYVIGQIRDKIDFANKNKISFSEFGTRRRYSSEIQNLIINELKERSETCCGTSNVFFAMTYNMKPIGTFPHEWVMFHGALFGYKRANFLSLEDWIDVYQGDLGTALIDTYTTDSFLRTLTKKQAHLLSGFRQDSGDEFEIGNKIIERLNEFGIDPKSKLIVFSNALNMEKANKIREYFQDKCKVSFGIGTNLTNDTDVSWKPANIVMKLRRCKLDESSPLEECVKLSDDIGKHTGSNFEVNLVKKELYIED